MAILFEHGMAVATIDYWYKLRPDGSSNWCVHCFNRMGNPTYCFTGLSKKQAKAKAARIRKAMRNGTWK